MPPTVGSAIRSGRLRRSPSSVPGTSAGLYPLWPQLIQVADQRVNEGLGAQKEDRDFWILPTTKPQQAVNGVKKALGKGLYATWLPNNFQPRCGADGKYYTSTHSHLLALPFKGVVTTNYDCALIEARAGAAAATGQRHCVGDLAGSGGHPKPGSPELSSQAAAALFCSPTATTNARIRWCWQPTSTVRLMPKGELFLELMKALWGRDSSLVFVGFGFSDPWLDFIAGEAIGETAGHDAEPRHIAIVGLKDGQAYTPEMRRSFIDQYNARPLFYPVTRADDGAEDHSALLAILEKLVADTAPPGRSGGQGGGGGAKSRRRHPPERARIIIIHRAPAAVGDPGAERCSRLSARCRKGARG